MSDWFSQNPGLIYQIYGLSFFVLGVVAYVLPRRDTTLRFARHVWLLAAFGVLHGTLEFVEWYRLQSSDPRLAVLATLLLTLSFVPLMEFGRRTLAEGQGIRISPVWLYGLVAAAVVALMLPAANPMEGLAAGARYFIGLPGALLAGFGLLALRNSGGGRIDVIADERHLPPWITVVGAALLVYALLTPWLTTAAAGLPAWLPTSGDFLSATGIPIQLLRALCAVAATIGLVNLVRHASAYSSDDLISVLDTIDGVVYRHKNAPDWPLVYLAGNMEELSGYQLHEFLDPNTITIGSLIHPEDRGLLWNETQKALKENRRFELIYRIVTRTGETRWIQERGQGIYGNDGELLYLQGHVMDASGLMAANEELRRERAALEDFRSTLDRLLDGVFMFDPDTLQFTYVNQGAVDQVGYSRDELLTLHPYDIKPEFPEPRFRQLVEPLRNGSRPSLRLETTHRTRDGNLVPVEIFLQYVKPDGGEARYLAISHDITQRLRDRDALMKALSELRESERKQAELLSVAQREQSRMAALLSGMSIGILFEDRHERVEYVNPAFRRMWAIPEGIELVGRPSREVLEHSTHRFARPDHASKHILHVLDTHEISERFEVDLYDGRILTQLSYPVPDPDGRIIGRLWIYEDVTHERQTAQQLIYLAEHDALTGLHNRHRFQQHLEQMINRARRTDGRFALLYFDLDEFKYINDTFGHRAGDTVLVRAAGEVASLVRSDEMFARLGGDEFAVLVELRKGDEPVGLAERIIHAISAIPFRFRGSNLRLTASIGIACFPEHGDNAEDLVAHADTAMYQAKDNGKNTWAHYDANRNTAAAMVARMTWSSRIAQALERGLLELHFQGIYHTRDGSLSHLESLVRMRDPMDEGRLVMPNQFIPVAEKTGQILEIDRWVIQRSIERLAAHPKLSALSVNISARSLDDATLPQFIDDELRRQKVEPKRFIIELTETAAVVEMQDAQRFIEALQHTGCLICLDDFGSGFSTFAYLKYLNIQILKIDGMFIRDLPNNRDNQAFVKAMIDVARGLDKVTVAEFVEDGDTLKMLREFGVDMAQGYHLDRPSAEHPSLGTL
ncbi:GGDEF domain-containing protein [Thioalkalivibrio denitrificans]|uniref:GGDEF domain-containing protein n=1 Tax=Thioalkalivibrio denitrificans TaxID=108003 RepID=A0A1V3NDP5_9GAMM|nr:EAL domain-containing protein [Thioalkalivibrio denitrificans]OOG22992.1 GGDEF domain-containing protein [Thioalkalivibrio denitrificans]